MCAAHMPPQSVHVWLKVYLNTLYEKLVFFQTGQPFSEARARSLITAAEWGLLNGIVWIFPCVIQGVWVWLREFFTSFFSCPVAANCDKSYLLTLCLHLPLWITYSYVFKWLLRASDGDVCKEEKEKFKNNIPSSKWPPLFNFRQRNQSLFYRGVALGQPNCRWYC